MKRPKIMRSERFLLESTMTCLITLVFYKKILFRNLKNMSYTASFAILWLLILIFVVWGTIIIRSEKIKIWDVAASTTLPFGAYTAFTYNHIYGRRIKILLCIGLIIALSLSSLVMVRKINRSRKRKIFFRRLRKCLRITSYIIAFCMSMYLIPLGSFGGEVVITSENVKTGTEIRDSSVSDMDGEALSLLQEENFQNLNVNQRLELMQIVANQEINFWGIPNELTVYGVMLNDQVNASYADHNIYFNLSYLETGSALELLQSCLHEVARAVQFAYVELYCSIDDEMKKFLLFDKAEIYLKEFQNYQSGSGSQNAENFNQYYFQQCEIDARSYANKRSSYYLQKINGNSNNEFDMESLH